MRELITVCIYKGLFGLGEGEPHEELVIQDNLTPIFPLFDGPKLNYFGRQWTI